MKENDQREYPRIATSNLIECCCLDENDNELDHCMARAINISPVGIKIEVFKELDSDKLRLLTVDTDGSLIDINGRIVYRNQLIDGRYEVGISFSGTEADNTRFVLKIIGHCHQAEPEIVMFKGAVNNRGERRKYPRVDINNLISYCCQDESGKDLDHCMARALDVNPLGARIETYQEILSENIHLTTVDADDNFIEIMGKVVHTHKFDDGRFEFGIQFTGTDAKSHFEWFGYPS